MCAIRGKNWAEASSSKSKAFEWRQEKQNRFENEKSRFEIHGQSVDDSVGLSCRRGEHQHARGKNWAEASSSKSKGLRRHHQT